MILSTLWTASGPPTRTRIRWISIIMDDRMDERPGRRHSMTTGFRWMIDSGFAGGPDRLGRRLGMGRRSTYFDG